MIKDCVRQNNNAGKHRNACLHITDEYNEHGHLLHIEDVIGAYTRAKTQEEALKKLEGELISYDRWAGTDTADRYSIKKLKTETLKSNLHIEDADSDMIFESEKSPLSLDDFKALTELALKSARDFKELYDSIPVKDKASRAPRKTFYGDVPITANEMYAHTKNVNSYYFGEIGISVSNAPDIYSCRKAGFEIAASKEELFSGKVYTGQYDELWSLKKVIRRFIWHDRIHAKAMYKMACALCGAENIKNPFRF